MRKERKTKDEIPSFAQSPKSFLIELLKIVLIALAVIIPIRYFLFQPFYVRGASMEPAFHDSEYLIIDEITYRFTEPVRGEVIVVRNPSHTSEFFIKRIIGLPGETVELQDGNVIIYNDEYSDGITLEEIYIGDEVQTVGSTSTTLSSEEFFVMGDNRQVSLDSRSFGPLNKEFIVGRAWLRVWPFNEFKHFEVPEYDYSK